MFLLKQMLPITTTQLIAFGGGEYTKSKSSRPSKHISARISPTEAGEMRKTQLFSFHSVHNWHINSGTGEGLKVV